VERPPLELGDLVEHWTLVGAERDVVAAKNYDTQLGFALLLKFYGRFGRFPRGRGELHDDAVEFVARQLDMGIGSVGFCEWSGRTVKRLIDMGLIVRDGPPARRYGTFSPTAEGARLHNLLEHAGRQRSEFLVQNLSTLQLDAFFTVFEIIAHNAEAQLNRERALDEVERAE